jgi:hypothetical protein
MVVIPDMEKVPTCYNCPCHEEAEAFGPEYCRLKNYLYKDCWAGVNQDKYPCPMKKVSVS